MRPQGQSPDPEARPRGPVRSVPLRAALISSVYLALITALARLSGQELLLFPELAALTTTVIAIPGHPWARSPRLLVLTPLLTGAVGIVVINLLPYGPVAVTLVVALSLLLIRALRSPVMPALASGMLPLALGVHSWLYPLALLPGCLGLALWIVLRRRRGTSPPSATPEQQPAPPRGDPPGSPLPPLGLWLGPLALFLAGALLLVQGLGSRLVLYPPLLVLAWETLARPDHCPWRGRPWALLAAIAAAAVSGQLLVHWLGPQPQTTALAVMLVALVLRALGLICPPVFAVVLLPFVLHHPPDSFPLHVLAGTAWLLLVAALSEAHRRRSGGRECPQ